MPFTVRLSFLQHRRLTANTHKSRDTAAAVGPNSGRITSHDFLARCSWGFEEGGWECEAGEGGESKLSPLWLGGDRLAATGLARIELGMSWEWPQKLQLPARLVLS